MASDLQPLRVPGVDRNNTERSNLKTPPSSAPPRIHGPTRLGQQQQPRNLQLTEASEAGAARVFPSSTLLPSSARFHRIPATSSDSPACTSGPLEVSLTFNPFGPKVKPIKDNKFPAQTLAQTPAAAHLLFNNLKSIKSPIVAHLKSALNQ